MWACECTESVVDGRLKDGGCSGVGDRKEDMIRGGSCGLFVFLFLFAFVCFVRCVLLIRRWFLVYFLCAGTVVAAAFLFYFFGLAAFHWVGRA